MENSLIKTPSSLTDLNFVDLNKTIEQRVSEYFTELQSCKVELIDEPGPDALTALYKVSTKAWVYYDRAQEIYRKLLLQKQRIFSLKIDYDNRFNLMRANLISKIVSVHGEKYSSFRSQAQRDEFINSFIDPKLFEQKLQLEVLLEACTTYVYTAKTFVEQFKASRENVLTQVSMIRTLMSMGAIKIDADIVAAMQQFNKSFESDAKVDVVSTKEGSISFGDKL